MWRRAASVSRAERRWAGALGPSGLRPLFCPQLSLAREQAPFRLVRVLWSLCPQLGKSNQKRHVTADRLCPVLASALTTPRHPRPRGARWAGPRAAQPHGKRDQDRPLLELATPSEPGDGAGGG